jgi:signal transduction histidine kinase
MNLYSRLAGSFVAVMFAGLLVFAAASVFAIDRTLRSTLDARLVTVANAAATFVDVSKGRIAIDPDDREQFLSLTAQDTQGAILDNSGTVLLSSAARPQAAVIHLRQDPGGFFELGKGEERLRAFVLPLLRHGQRAGTVVVWRGIDWIDETDRNAAIAFAVGALLIAALSLVAGNSITRSALEDAFARQRRFTADASHELRAPLAVIRAEADLALRKERDVAQYRSALEMIASEADRIESLIGDLLAAARAESARAARERVDVAHVTEIVRERLAPAAAAKNIRIGVRADRQAVILAEPQTLERALLAIAHNAVKYAPAAGEVDMSVARTGEHVEVLIEDDGPGFTAEALEHASERFWREETSRPHPGTGLGLAIARSIAESFGGEMLLSNGDRGAQVRLRFSAASR